MDINKLTNEQLLSELRVRLATDEGATNHISFKQITNIQEQYYIYATGEEPAITMDASLEGQDYKLSSPAWLTVNDSDGDGLSVHLSPSDGYLKIDIFNKGEEGSSPDDSFIIAYPEADEDQEGARLAGG